MTAACGLKLTVVPDDKIIALPEQEPADILPSG
jgi:hypothetical protein